MDPRCAPEGIGKDHLAGQVSDFLGNPWSAGDTPRLPPPDSFRAAPMPTHDGLGVDNDDRAQTCSLASPSVESAPFGLWQTKNIR